MTTQKPASLETGFPILCSLLSALFLLPLPLHFIAQEDSHHKADEAHHQRAEEGRPETSHRKTDAEHFADGACEPEQEGVDHEREQAERQDDGQASHEFRHRPHEHVHQSQDQAQAD